MVKSINYRHGIRAVLAIIFVSMLTHVAWSDEGRKIATAVQRGGFIYAYDEKGSQMFSVSAGSGAKDGLAGYTSSTLSVRRGGFIYVYNNKGTQISSVSAGN